MTIQVKESALGTNLREFIGVAPYVYRDDPNWVRPLDMDLKQRLSQKNPFFEHAEGVLLTAHRNGFCVGRASVQIDRLHLERYKDDVGFFGFFDTIDDAEVAKALLDYGARWLKERGMKRMRGPVSLSLNDESGCLVEGFDTPPMLMMPHHLPYQGGLIEQAGFTKCKDLFAWRYRVGDEAERLLRGFLSKALFDAGLYCRADDRGDPVVQLAPPLTIGQSEFDEIEQILRTVLTEGMNIL